MADTSKTTSRPYPAQAWRMPPLDTTYLCDDGYYRSLGDLVAGLDEDEVPHDDEGLMMLLSVFGVDWTRPISYGIAQRDEALRAKWERDEATHQRWLQEREECVGIPEMPDYPDQITGAM